jgi:hypothetical protein
MDSFLLFVGLTDDFYVSEDMCRKAADEFAKGYLKLSDYEVKVTPMELEKNCFYYFDYYRSIGGHKTNDGMCVTVNGNGKVVAFTSYMLGSFGGSAKLSVDKTKADAAFNEKLNAMYGEFDEWSFKIKDETLIMTENGNQAFLYTVDVEIREYIPEEGEDVYMSIGEIVSIVVEAKPVQSN